MLTLEDCLAFCELTEEEIDAIAEHEHLPETLAVELGSCLIHKPDGGVLIRRMIVHDIRAAHARGSYRHAAQLEQTLRHFIEAHGAGRSSAPAAGCTGFGRRLDPGQ